MRCVCLYVSGRKEGRKRERKEKEQAGVGWTRERNKKKKSVNLNSNDPLQKKKDGRSQSEPSLEGPTKKSLMTNYITMQD